MKKLLIGLGAVIVLVALVAAAAGLARSGAGAGEGSDASAGEAAMQAVAPDAGSNLMTDQAAVEAEDADQSTQRGSTTELDQAGPSTAMIRTGTIDLGSDDLERDLQAVRGVASSVGGQVSAEESYGSTAGADRDRHAQLTLRVPEPRFEQAMERLAELGTVHHRAVSSEDVSTQVIDVRAKVRAQRASVRSLEKLMARAKTVGEVMSVERELVSRQARLDSLLQRQAHLADQTSRSTIHVSLSNREVVEESEKGFIGGLKTGWAALVTTLVGLATVGGVLLPFVPVVLVLGGLAVWLGRRRRRPVTPLAESAG